MHTSADKSTCTINRVQTMPSLRRDNLVSPLPVVLRCDDRHLRKVRYVFDTLFLAAGIPIRYLNEPPPAGPVVVYGGAPDSEACTPASHHVLSIHHDVEAWRHFERGLLAERAYREGDLKLVFAPKAPCHCATIPFDLPANAFYFLSSWAERVSSSDTSSSRQLYAASEFVRLGIPQDIVDRYLTCLLGRLRDLCSRLGAPNWPSSTWPGNTSFAVVLSHDVDFLPVRFGDNCVQLLKTVARHLLHHRDGLDAVRAFGGWLRAAARRRDPYGCVPEIISRELALGVRSSFQVAVGHRHPNDVNYRIEDDRVRDYLRSITDAGFDLCLHGSYRSAENPGWYREEAESLSRRLARPLGSRQHFLSFKYDCLFTAQEAAGIRYDMSMGYPDQPGPRAGFSFPYFPYNLAEDRPYSVLQISLFLMDVTLRAYLRMRARSAQQTVSDCLMDLHQKRGCASVVWHPIVFAAARDPGYDQLYFQMVREIKSMGGLATDGRTIDLAWRERARNYSSFMFAAGGERTADEDDRSKTVASQAI